MRVHGIIEKIVGILAMFSGTILFIYIFSKNMNELLWYAFGLIISGALNIAIANTFTRDADRLDKVEIENSHLRDEIRDLKNKMHSKDNNNYDLTMNNSNNYSSNKVVINKIINDNKDYLLCPHCGFKNYFGSTECGNCFAKLEVNQKKSEEISNQRENIISDNINVEDIKKSTTAKNSSENNYIICPHCGFKNYYKSTECGNCFKKLN